MTKSSVMKKLYSYFLILIISKQAFACPKDRFEQKVILTEIEGAHSIYIEGAYSTCEQQCLGETKCQKKCQKNLAIPPLKLFISERFGSQYLQCDFIKKIF